MSRRRTREEQRAITRRRLIDAAARVFARRGFHAASVEEIAEAAGYSHGAVYSNFESKEDLFLAVYEDRAAMRAREVTAAVEETEGPFSKKAAAAADQWMERFGRDPDAFLLSLEFLTQAARDERLREQFAIRVSAVPQTMTRLLEEYAREAGLALPLPAADMAVAVRYALARVVSPDDVREDLFSDFVSLVFRLVEESGSARAPRGRPSAPGRTA